jgi:hypothetical protein
MAGAGIRKAVAGCAAAALGLVVAAAAPAHARWLKATTHNFILYSLGSEEDLRRSGQHLENFDALLRLLNARKLPPAETKLPVYWIRGRGDLRILAPSAPEGINGFYLATPGAIAAIATRRAYELVPQVNEIGVNTAVALMQRKLFAEAINVLRPITFDPHGDDIVVAYARQLLAAAENKHASGNDWKSFNPVNSFH